MGKKNQSRQQRRQEERKKLAEEKKLADRRKFRRIITVPSALALGALVLYSSINYYQKQNVGVSQTNTGNPYTKYLIAETQAELKDPNKSSFEKVLAVFKTNALLYYNRLMQKPSNEDAFSAYTDCLGSTFRSAMSLDTNVTNAIRQMGLSKVKGDIIPPSGVVDLNVNAEEFFPKYFREKGYFYTPADISLSGGRNYRGVFLAKIRQKKETDIPMFTSKKQYKIMALEFGNEVVPLFFKYENQMTNAHSPVSSSFHSPEKNSIEVLVDTREADGLIKVYRNTPNEERWKIILKKYGALDKEYEKIFMEDALRTAVIHEGTHIFFRNNKLLRENGDTGQEETLAFINEIINGGNPHYSVWVICYENVGLPGYDYAKKIISPYYGNKADIEQRSEQEIRNIAKKIYQENYQWLIPKIK